MDFELLDRVFVVIDGADELAKATALVLASEGARVVLGGSDERALTSTVAEIGPDRAVAVPGAGPTSECGGVVGLAHSTWGRLDGALVVPRPPVGAVSVREVEDHTWSESFEETFLSTLHVIQQVGSALTPGGSIAVVFRSAIHESTTGHVVGDVLERGLATVVLQLSDELGPRGVRVNGLVAGAMASANDVPQGPVARAEDSWPDLPPLGRHGSPAEFARVAAFVLSPAASYISGTLWPVDGGVSRHG